LASELEEHYAGDGEQQQALADLKDEAEPLALVHHIQSAFKVEKFKVHAALADRAGCVA
jgi:hypothetical protein